MNRFRVLLAILTFSCFKLGLAADPNSNPDKNNPASIHSNFSGVFSLMLDGNQLKPGGRVIGGMTATQRLVLNRTDNFTSGDRLRGMVLMSLDLESREPSDGTFGVEYGNLTTLPEKIVRGYKYPHFGDRWSVGYQYWKLRKETGVTPSHFIYCRWNHYSRAEWAVTAMYGFPCNGCQSSGLVDFRMTDSYVIPGVGESMRVIPLVGVAYGVNWYSATHDGTVLTLGISVNRMFHRQVRLSLNLGNQRRLSGNEAIILNKTWIGAVAEILF